METLDWEEFEGAWQSMDAELYYIDDDLGSFSNASVLFAEIDGGYSWTVEGIDGWGPIGSGTVQAGSLDEAWDAFQVNVHQMTIPVFDA